MSHRAGWAAREGVRGSAESFLWLPYWPARASWVWGHVGESFGQVPAFINERKRARSQPVVRWRTSTSASACCAQSRPARLGAHDGNQHKSGHMASFAIARRRSLGGRNA